MRTDGALLSIALKAYRMCSWNAIHMSGCAHHAGEVAGVGVVRAAQHARPHQEALLLHLYGVRGYHS